MLPFLDAAGEDSAREQLGELLIGHASPLIRQIVGRQLLSSGGAAARVREQDAEDLHGTLMLRLTAQLWELRREDHNGAGEAAPIASFAGYVARAAFNACHEWLRQRAPRRARLQSRVRYVLTHDARLTMREAANRDWWCGLSKAAAKTGTEPDGSDVSLDIVRAAADQQAAAVRRDQGDPAVSPRAFAAFVYATVAAVGRPCRFATASSASSLSSSQSTGSAPAAPAGRTAAPASAGVLPFERKAAGPTKSGRGSRRFGTATVIVGAMAAAMIGAVTWMVVRTARVNDPRPGAPGGPGSQVARQHEQPEAPQQRSPQPPPTKSPGSAPGSTSGPGSGSGASAPQVAVRDAGGLIAIDAAGAVTGLPEDAAAQQPMTQLVADALTKGTLPPAASASGLGGRELTLMSRTRQAPASRLAPLSPIATIVRSTRPVFRWSPHAAARGYVVTVYGPDFEKVMASPSLTDTTWTATEGLKPGVTYQWQVTADTPEGLVRAPAPPAPDARFRIIDAAAKTLDRDLARAGTSRLLKGILLTQAGVLDEAEEAFVALQAENPDSKRVSDLLARVRDRRFSQ